MACVAFFDTPVKRQNSPSHAPYSALSLSLACSCTCTCSGELGMAFNAGRTCDLNRDLANSVICFRLKFITCLMDLRKTRFVRKATSYCFRVQGADCVTKSPSASRRPNSCAEFKCPVLRFHEILNHPHHLDPLVFSLEQEEDPSFCVGGCSQLSFDGERTGHLRNFLLQHAMGLGQLVKNFNDRVQLFFHNRLFTRFCQVSHQSGVRTGRCFLDGARAWAAFLPLGFGAASGLFVGFFGGVEYSGSNTSERFLLWVLRAL